MSTYETLAQRYVDAWNTTGTAARRDAVERLWGEDGRYVDPLVEARGSEQIAGTIAAVQEQFPGWVFRLVGQVEGHHDTVRFAWELGPSGADAPVAGSDVAVVGPDGRLAAVHGFLDRVPAAV